MVQLTGKTAPITGASRSVGRATAFSDDTRWVSGDIVQVHGGSKL